MSIIINVKTFILDQKCTQIKLFLLSVLIYCLLGLMSTKILVVGKISTLNKNTLVSSVYRK